MKQEPINENMMEATSPQDCHDAMVVGVNVVEPNKSSVGSSNNNNNNNNHINNHNNSFHSQSATSIGTSGSTSSENNCETSIPHREAQQHDQQKMRILERPQQQHQRENMNNDDDDDGDDEPRPELILQQNDDPQYTKQLVAALSASLAFERFHRRPPDSNNGHNDAQENYNNYYSGSNNDNNKSNNNNSKNNHNTTNYHHHQQQQQHGDTIRNFYPIVGISPAFRPSSHLRGSLSTIASVGDYSLYSTSEGTTAAAATTTTLRASNSLGGGSSRSSFISISGGANTMNIINSNDNNINSNNSSSSTNSNNIAAGIVSNFRLPPSHVRDGRSGSILSVSTLNSNNSGGGATRKLGGFDDSLRTTSSEGDNGNANLFQQDEETEEGEETNQEGILSIANVDKAEYNDVDENDARIRQPVARKPSHEEDDDISLNSDDLMMNESPRSNNDDDDDRDASLTISLLDDQKIPARKSSSSRSRKRSKSHSHNHHNSTPNQDENDNKDSPLQESLHTQQQKQNMRNVLNNLSYPSDDDDDTCNDSIDLMDIENSNLSIKDNKNKNSTSTTANSNNSKNLTSSATALASSAKSGLVSSMNKITKSLRPSNNHRGQRRASTGDRSRDGYYHGVLLTASRRKQQHHHHPKRGSNFSTTSYQIKHSRRQSNTSNHSPSVNSGAWKRSDSSRSFSVSWKDESMAALSTTSASGNHSRVSWQLAETMEEDHQDQNIDDTHDHYNNNHYRRQHKSRHHHRHHRSGSAEGDNVHSGRKNTSSNTTNKPELKESKEVDVDDELNLVNRGKIIQYGSQDDDNEDNEGGADDNNDEGSIDLEAAVNTEQNLHRILREHDRRRHSNSAPDIYNSNDTTTGFRNFSRENSTRSIITIDETSIDLTLFGGDSSMGIQSLLQGLNLRSTASTAVGNANPPNVNDDSFASITFRLSRSTSHADLDLSDSIDLTQISHTVAPSAPDVAPNEMEAETIGDGEGDDHEHQRNGLIRQCTPRERSVSIGNSSTGSASLSQHSQHSQLAPLPSSNNNNNNIGGDIVLRQQQQQQMQQQQNNLPSFPSRRASSLLALDDYQTRLRKKREAMGLEADDTSSDFEIKSAIAADALLFGSGATGINISHAVLLQRASMAGNGNFGMNAAQRQPQSQRNSTSSSPAPVDRFQLMQRTRSQNTGLDYIGLNRLLSFSNPAPPPSNDSETATRSSSFSVRTPFNTAASEITPAERRNTIHIEQASQVGAFQENQPAPLLYRRTFQPGLREQRLAARRASRMSQAENGGESSFSSQRPSRRPSRRISTVDFGEEPNSNSGATSSDTDDNDDVDGTRNTIVRSNRRASRMSYFERYVQEEISSRSSSSDSDEGAIEVITTNLRPTNRLPRRGSNLSYRSSRSSTNGSVSRNTYPYNQGLNFSTTSQTSAGSHATHHTSQTSNTNGTPNFRSLLAASVRHARSFNAKILEAILVDDDEIVEADHIEDIHNNQRDDEHWMNILEESVAHLEEQIQKQVHQQNKMRRRYKIRERILCTLMAMLVIVVLVLIAMVVKKNASYSATTKEDFGSKSDIPAKDTNFTATNYSEVLF